MVRLTGLAKAARKRLGVAAASVAGTAAAGRYPRTAANWIPVATSPLYIGAFGHF